MATSNRSTVVGIFDDRRQAERAVDALHKGGFRDDQIGFVHRDGETAEGATSMGAEGHGGAPIGTGAVIGGVLGAAAALLIPGLGPVLAGGILAPILGAAAGAVAGGVVGALTELGVPEEEANYANEQFQAGRTLVTVKADGRYDEAQAILKSFGADNTHTDQAGSRSTTSTAAASTAGSSAASAAAGSAGGMRRDTRGTRDRESDSKEVRVPVTEENLVTRKRAQETGAVEVQKRVVEETKTIDVPVRREEVNVERVATDRPLAPGEKGFTDETVRVPVYEEEVIVEKRPHVVGEVVISKEARQEQQAVSGTVRREQVDVERTGGEQSGTYRSWSEVMPTYRSAWQQRYGSTGGRWEDYAPAYEFGYNSYNGPQYRGRSWDQAEAGLRQDWQASGNRTPWEKVKDSIHDAWDRARGTA